MNLKIQRRFLFKILFGLERFQLGSVDACVSTVFVVPRGPIPMEWMHKGFKPDDGAGSLAEL